MFILNNVFNGKIKVLCLMQGLQCTIQRKLPLLINWHYHIQSYFEVCRERKYTKKWFLKQI